MDDVRIALSGTLLALAAVALVVAERRSGYFGPTPSGPWLVSAVLVGGVLAAVAAVLLPRPGARRTGLLVVGGAALLGLAGLATAPTTSTDSARYAWDGIVASHGTSPYAHVPAADDLAGWRPSWLFPVGPCPGGRFVTGAGVPSGDPLCTALNRVGVPTIYPPFAQGFFALVRALVPVSARFLPFQVAGLVLVVAVTAVLVVAMRRRGTDPRWAACWGWSPFVVLEAVNNAHVDVLGCLAGVLGTLVLAVGGRRRRTVLGGILLGLAVVTKFVPALLVPPLLRRRPVTLLVSIAATVGLSYVPYVVWTGRGVLGFLPGYLSEEGYDSGRRFVLLGFLSGGTATTVALLLLALAAVLAWRLADPDRPWTAQTVLTGSALLIVSPTYPWYSLLLVPGLALSRRPEWLLVPLALEARVFSPDRWPTVVLVAAVLVLVASLLRARRRSLAPHRTLEVVS